MRNLPALTRRELVGAFCSPTAYIVLTILMAFAGVIFYLSLELQRVASLETWFIYMSVLLLFVAPVITMRLLAEEYARGSIEMLMTAPVTEAEVALSKYLGAMLLYLFLLLPTLAFPAALRVLGRPDPGPVLTGYLGLLLSGSFLLAAGLFFSSLTRRQIVAAFLGVVVFVLLFVVGFVGPWLGGWAGAALASVGLLARMQGFIVGVVDLRDVAYFVTGTVLFLFLSVKVLELRRC